MLTFVIMFLVNLKIMTYEGLNNYFIDNFVDSRNNNSFCDKLKNSEYDMLQAFMVSNCSVFSTAKKLSAVNNLSW